MVKFEKKKISKEEFEKMGIKNWGTWTSPPPPGFDWTYDGKETFYIIDGEAEIISGDDKIEFGPGDLVTVYPETGKCRWNVKKTIKKYYTFD
ncbi:MAG: cupin domain-containing protein [Promethearchaeota archaeon]